MQATGAHIREEQNRNCLMRRDPNRMLKIQMRVIINMMGTITKQMKLRKVAVMMATEVVILVK